MVFKDNSLKLGIILFIQGLVDSLEVLIFFLDMNILFLLKLYVKNIRIIYNQYV